MLGVKKTFSESALPTTIYDVAKKRIRIFPNAAARRLIYNKTYNIALIVSDIANPAFSGLIKGFQFIANQQQYGVFLFDKEERVEKEITIFEMLVERRMDGINIAAPRMRNSHPIDFSHKKIPVVLYNRRSSNKDFSSILINEYHSALKVVSYLMELGHRRIGFISGPVRFESCINKYKGYRAGIKKHGLSLDEKLVAIGDATPTGGFRATQRLLSSKNPPTAVFVFDDYSALGVYEFAYQRGIQIPDNLSIIESDDIFCARLLNPPLDTLSILYYQVGNLLATTLFRIIKGR